MSYCKGCGIKLQSTDENKIGFIPKEKIEFSICQRCYKLHNYNIDLFENNINIDFEKIIKEIKNDDTLIYVLDLFNVYSFDNIKKFQIYFKNIVFLINKVDLLNPKYNLDFLRKRVKEEIEVSDIPVYKILLFSSLDKDSIIQLSNIIDSLESKNIWFVGDTNVGKSSIMNKFLKLNNIENNLTISSKFNTTLNINKIKMNNKNIIDLPGLNAEKSFLNYAITKYKKIFDQKTISKTFLLKPDYTLNIDEMILIKNNSNVEFNSKFILLNNIKILIKKTIYNNIVKEWQTINLKFSNNNRLIDIILPGIGYITIKEQGQSLSLTIPEDVTIKVNNSIFKESDYE